MMATPYRLARPTRRAVLAGLCASAATACTPAGPIDLPSVALPGLPGLTRYGWPVPGIGERQFLGRVSVLNVWASWCGYCQGEHETVMRLSGDGRFAVVGLVYLDKPEKAVAYLKRAGNPFSALALDRGEFTRTLRQRGVPSTYVVDRHARVIESVRGGIGDDTVRALLMPAIERALRA